MLPEARVRLVLLALLGLPWILKDLEAPEAREDPEGLSALRH